MGGSGHAVGASPSAGTPFWNRKSCSREIFTSSFSLAGRLSPPLPVHGTGRTFPVSNPLPFPSPAASSKSSNTSKYFGSIDSSENDLPAKKRSEVEDNEHFIKYVLQDPIWLLMANTDDKVMMSYQLPVR